MSQQKSPGTEKATKSVRRKKNHNGGRRASSRIPKSELGVRRDSQIGSDELLETANEESRVASGSQDGLRAAQPERKAILRSGATRPWQENLSASNASTPSPTQLNVSTPESSPEQASPDSIPDLERVKILSEVIARAGAIVNGYEYRGEENIPSKGGALFVFYHGLVPLDAWYFGAEYFRRTGRLVRGLGDDFVFKTPGLSWLARTFGAQPGNPETAVKLLRSGELVGVSPGGVREAISGTPNNYKLMWGKRVGFAKVALEAQVPILPAFTANIEETYRAPFAETSLLQNIYEQTRLPLVPIVGLGLLPFPVKITTWIGEPVQPRPFEKPEELALRTREAVQKLIDQHQPRKQQSIIEALKDRFLK